VHFTCSSTEDEPQCRSGTTEDMTEENITIDEIIINIIWDNKYIYDKTDPQCKNHSKKKDIWKLISFQLKDVYDMNDNMSGKCILWK